MRISEVSVPEVYKESGDFRFFLKWFEECLTKVHYDTENMPDMYDPLRCPDWLLWMLADTMGFKYDDRLPVAFNRLVLVYFMSMIRHKGSKDGVTLAAETNLAQFNLINYGKEKSILQNRLEDTSIPVNSVYVTPHVEEGYIDVVYFSAEKPIDACIEYVRPVGMYLAQYAGVRMDARDKISIDARLTNTNNLGMSIGPTHVGHYSRRDYASMQRVKNDDDWKTMTYPTRYKYDSQHPDKLTKRQQYRNWVEDEDNKNKAQHLPSDDTYKSDYSTDEYITEQYNGHYIYKRENVWYRNSEFEKEYTPNRSSEWINPGLRALYSLQLCNNEHIVESLLDPIFGLGYLPQKHLKRDEEYVQDPENPRHTFVRRWFTGDGVKKVFEVGHDIDYIISVKVNDKIVNGVKSGFRNVVLDTAPAKDTAVVIDYQTTYVLRDTVDLIDDKSKYPVSTWLNEQIASGKIQVTTHNEDYPGVFPNAWNLRYDKENELEAGTDVWTIEDNRSTDVVTPRPAVNPIMATMGDAISLNTENTQYIVKDDTSGELEIHKVEPDGKIIETD